MLVRRSAVRVAGLGEEADEIPWGEHRFGRS
jgi:hypothetical protein